MTSDYIYVRGTTAYLLDKYYPDADAEELISLSRSAAHITKVDNVDKFIDGLKKKPRIKTAHGYHLLRDVGVGGYAIGLA